MELLVAISIFIILAGVLVYLLSSGIEMWRNGETRKDLLERVQLLSSQLEDDLLNAYAEREPSKTLRPAEFVVDRDQLGRARLRWVRAGRGADAVGGRTAGHAARLQAPADLYEVAWLYSPNPAMAADPTLYRILIPFDRTPRADTVFDDELIETPRFFQGATTAAYPADRGTAGLDVLLWTEATTSWSGPPPTGRRARRTAGRAPAQGPETVWDSYRRRDPLRSFFLHQGTRTGGEPDPVYPEAVRFTLWLVSLAGEERGTPLVETLPAGGTTLSVGSARDFPDPPAFLRVGSEWIEYAAKTHNRVLVKTRGARGTKPQDHEAGERVYSGEPFTVTYSLPVRKESTR